MFLKFASIALAEKITVADWKKFLVSADVKTPLEGVNTLAEFDLDTSNFLYVRCRAVSAGEYHGENANGDFFPEAELKKSYKTFIHRGVFLNHQSEDPSKAVGIILDALWHEGGKYVELLLGIDKSELIANKIAHGIATNFSMGAMVAECQCSVCGKSGFDESSLCEHLKTSLGKEVAGKKVYSINKGLNFYEISSVTVPADSQAVLLEVLASKKENQLPTKFLDLAKDYDSKNNDNKTIEEVKNKLARVVTDQQILGQVKHKLKIASVQTSVKSDDKTKQHVESALEVGSMMVEEKNLNIETNPLEGIKVENQLTIRYVPGNSLDKCYFIARRGRLQTSVSAASILDNATKLKIEAFEKAKQVKTGAGKATLIKDDSKPKPDNVHELGKDPSQPSDVVKKEHEGFKEIKDDSKPKPDNVHNLGKDPEQPSDVVKKYAQLVGAKSITFKKGEAGSFTAILSGGNITRLAALWNTVPRIVPETKKVAKIGGEPMAWAKETFPQVQTDPMEHKNMMAREPAKGPGKGTGSLGNEVRSYFGKLDPKGLSEGGGEQWARKVNELTKVASNLTAENKALRLENNTLKKSLEAVKMASVEEKKSTVVAQIMGEMEKVGAIKVDSAQLYEFQENGLNHEQANAKAYASAYDKKVAELKSLDLKALQTMAKNLSDFIPSIKTTAARKDFILPQVSKDEGTDDADRLSRNWA